MDQRQQQHLRARGSEKVRQAAAPSSVQFQPAPQKVADLSPNNLWALAAKKATEETKKEERVRTFIFVGDKKSGKSSIILKHLEMDLQNNDYKETVALDYKWAEKKNYPDEQKVMVNTYELGGGRNLSDMLQAPLNAKNVPDIATICICIDLSKPGNIIDSLLYWMVAVKEHSQNALKDLQNLNMEAFTKQRQESSEYWNNAVGSEKSQQSKNLIPITVICTHYDIFAKKLEPVQKKTIYQGIRCICHMNGADCVFSSTIEKEASDTRKKVLGWHTFRFAAGTAVSAIEAAGDDPKKSEQEKQLLDDTKVDMKFPPENADEKRPLCMMAGQDKKAQQLQPPGSGQSSKSIEELWKGAVERDGHQKVSEQDTGELKSLKVMHEFQEDKVDKMRQQKDQELEDYKKEIERAKRSEKSKLLQQSQQRGNQF